MKFGEWFKFETRYGTDGSDWTKYQTVLALGRLRLHIFWRGDGDPDPHDHMWDFWTFPLVSYVERVWSDGASEDRLVRFCRLHRRPAELRHLVLGKFSPMNSSSALLIGSHGVCRRITRLGVGSGAVVTIVWRGRKRRDWGFWVDSGTRFVPWRDYVYGGVR